MINGRGVRKVNESIMQQGRTIIVTENDRESLNWERIPDGTLKVDPVSGQIFVKVLGEADWIPAGLNHDGTITIAKDANIKYEVFVIKNPNNEDGTFTYTNQDGEDRTKPLTAEGLQTFELEKGSYVMKRNKIEVYINDTLHRSAEGGGLVEIDETRFSLSEILTAGTEVSVKYYERVNIGNPYPRFWITDQFPERKEYGDFWLDIRQKPSSLKWWDGAKWIAANSREFDSMLGGPSIYEGFDLQPGTGRAINVRQGGMLMMDGQVFTETRTTIAVAIAANSTGANRIDTIYAEVVDGALHFKAAVGTTNAPAGTCKLGEVTVPNGASSILAGNIRQQEKALTILRVSDDLNKATSMPTAYALAKRDSAGRMRASAPVHGDDVVRKTENDETMAVAQAAVRRAGDTMTGGLNINGHGIHAYIEPIAATTAGSSYPMGMTTFLNTVANGYPETRGVVVTFRANTAAATQWFYSEGKGSGTDATHAWVRHWTSTNGWTYFKPYLALGERDVDAYRGDRGKIAYEHAMIRDANPHKSTFASLEDVTLATLVAGNFPRYDGAKWVNKLLAAGDIPSLDTSKITTGVFDFARIPTGTTAQTVAVGNHNHTLDSLSNTVISSKASGEILKWDGSAWINNTLAEAGIQATITGAATTIDSEDLTASRALISSSAGKVAVSAATATELGYLSGVTSAVQAQMDNRITGSTSGQKIYVQTSKPTSGMSAGDIWIDTSVSYGTK